MISKMNLLLALSFLVAACGESASTVEVRDASNLNLDAASSENSIPFRGTWSRTFKAGEHEHQATYEIENEHIRYTLTGLHTADYEIVRDEFIARENRFVGHDAIGNYYVIFVRDVSDDSLTLYKKKSIDIDSALAEPVPPIDDAQNHGWNAYIRKK